MPSIASGEWWRLLSSIAVHGSFSHLFSNLFALIVLAVPLEHTYGAARVFIIFLAAGE
jgi:rhomboid protease GluP